MFIRVRDTELHVVTEGSGPLCLVVHGAPGVVDHNVLRNSFLPMGPLGRTLVFWDHRECGRSRRQDHKLCTLDNLVEDMEALREELGAGRVDVFGHSWGGIIAQEYAARYPDRLRSLHLCDTAPDLQWAATYGERVGPFEPAEYREKMKDLYAGQLPEAEADRLLEEWFLTVAVGDPRPEFRAALAGTRRNVRAIGALNASVRGGWSAQGRLQHVTAPVLVSHGAHDRIIPAADGRRAAANIPGARFVLFPRSGHSPFLEELAPFAALLREFWAV